MSEPADPLTEPQIRAAILAVAEYVRIHEKELGRRPSYADALHSSLLSRLLSGKPALDRPPPLRFSYPDYALAEGREVEVSEVSGPHVGLGVVVDQGGGWSWHDEPTQVLRYDKTGDLYQLSSREVDQSRFARGREPEVYRRVAKFLRKIDPASVVAAGAGL